MNCGDREGLRVLLREKEGEAMRGLSVGTDKTEGCVMTQPFVTCLRVREKSMKNDKSSSIDSTSSPHQVTLYFAKGANGEMNFFIYEALHRMRRALLISRILAHESRRLYSHTTLKHRHQLCRTTKSSTFYVGNDPTSLASALSFAEKVVSPILGTQFHGCIVKLGFTNHIFTQNNLVKLYSKCGQLRDGLRVFYEMPERNIVSWTLLVSGSIQCAEFELGLEMYLQMMRCGVVPNEYALGSVLKLCADEKHCVFGLCNHCLALKIGMETDPHVSSSILTFYAKLGDIEAAETVFKCIKNVDIGCWNAMIGGYTQCGYGFEAISMVSSMQCEGIMMDKYTLISALQGCSLAGNLNFGRQIHGFIFTSEVESSTCIMNALMDMYFKNDEIDSALKVFRRMNDRDVVTLNTVCGNFSRYDDPKEVVSFFNEFMLSDLKPNHVSFSVLFRQCGELLELDLGLQFCSLAIHVGFFDEGNVISSLIVMFSHCGAMEMARLVFDSIKFKNIIIWNELISGYIFNYCYIEAIKSYYNLLQFGFEANECTFSTVLEACCTSENQKMSRQIHGAVVKSGFASDGYVCSALIKCYVKLGLLDDTFEFINGYERLDMASWGCMISTLMQQGYNYEAISVFNSLKEVGQKPDEFILGSILNSCANIAAYYQTKSMHPFIIKLGFECQLCVVSAVLDAYAKCGDIKSANMVFYHSCKNRDAIMYNSMIIAYARHGLVVEAFEIFNEMKLAKLQPSSSTFVSVISACSHMGQVDLGCLLFKSIEAEYGLKPSPDNYGCLIDMLSRSGYLEDAKQMIQMMPYPPWPAILRSLLSGCRTYGNRELGEWAAEKLFKLVPENDAVYALLFDFYSERGNWEDAADVRRKMIEKTARKDPGYSWIEAR